MSSHLPTSPRERSGAAATADENVAPETRARANRAIWLLYGVMALFILGPLLLLWWRQKS